MDTDRRLAKRGLFGNHPFWDWPQPSDRTTV